VNNTKDIQKLLEKYFESDSTLLEETILRKYFSDKDSVSPELESYSSLFNYISDGKQKSGIEDKILHKKKSILRSSIISIVSAAAILIIFFTFTNIRPISNSILFTHYVNGIQIEDVDTGMAEASEILNSISQNISGTLSKVPRQAPFNTINDNLNKMEYEKIINFKF